jgi:membrane fusion protein, multidrug efflux system
MKVSIPILILLLGLLFGGCARRADEGSSTAAPPVVKARTAAVERVTVPETIELSGSVEADRMAVVSSRVMATVTAVHVRPGDAVRRGQTLVEIDPRTAAGQLGQARGGLAQAEAGLALAARNHERFKALAAANAASQLELDMARTQYEQARGAVDQARGAVAAAGSVAGESRVVAPFDGRVVAKMVEVGDLAAPGRPLVQIESAAAHRLSVAVPESLLARAPLAVGSAVEVAIDARPDLGRFPAKVVERSSGADPMAHAFTLKLSLGGAQVPSGAYGRAWVSNGERSTLAVPRDAVLRQGGTDLVVVRQADGTAASRVVTLGAELQDGRVEVLSGLAGGETVLLGLAAVPPLGARVEPLETAP